MRTCGNCSVCCYVSGVPELQKPAHTNCDYYENGCILFGSSNRPKLCNTFSCLWLRGVGLSEDRPDLSGVFCLHSEMNGGRWVFVIETAPNAVLTTGRKIVKRLARIADVPVIIVDHGILPPFDKGNRTIVKKEFLNRSKKMRGNFIKFIDSEEQLGMYELIVG